MQAALSPGLMVDMQLHPYIDGLLQLQYSFTWWTDMIHRGYKYLSYFVIIFSGLSYASADYRTVFFDKDFTLSIGESVKVESGLGFIKFIKVLEDSRCPVNVTCVWAGNVKTEFEILDSDRKKTSIFLNTGIQPNKLSLPGYTLQLISVFPPKVEGVAITPEEYQVKLSIKQTH